MVARTTGLGPAHAHTAAWALLFAGLLALYAPAYLHLANTLWRSGDYAHGPIIAAVSLWLLFRMRGDLARLAAPPSLVPALLPLGIGLALQIAGRVSSTPEAEMAAQIPLAAAILMLIGGTAALRRAWFPLVFLLFMIPLPGVLVVALTESLKAWIALLAVGLLYAAGLPVAHQGNVISIGQYQLFLGDACAGMHSMFALSALGVLFVHLSARASWRQNAILLGSILPIAFIANLGRVLLLLLATFYFGDGVARSIHELAGILVFAVELALLHFLDRSLVRSECRGAPSFAATAPRSATAARPAVFAAALMAAAVAGALLQPAQRAREPVDLNGLAPERFGGWSKLADEVRALDLVEVDRDLPNAYQQQLAAVYAGPQGERIMLAIAYAPNQLSDRLHAHRAEYCYRAQGFSISRAADEELATAFGRLPVRRLYAELRQRKEPVTYWMTVNDRPVLPGWSRKLAQLRSELAGTVPDGLLVRVSSIDRDARRGYAVQDRFIRDWLALLPEKERLQLAGRPDA